MHTLAWLAWVLLVMTVALTTNNPYYLSIVFLGVILVAVLAPTTGTGLATFRALLLFGLSLFAVSVVIAVINGNFGDHILFTLPGPELPDWMGGLRLGGPVSAEGLVAACIRGLAILTVLLAFGVFNGAVSPHRALRTAPAALFHAGLVVTVGLSLLPATIEDTRRIREMRALRGARTGLRELPALVVPSVINGLERSMRLAEAMEARGYASSSLPPRPVQLLGGVSIPLLILAAWGWYYYEWAQPLAVMAASLGITCLVAWFVAIARRRTVTRLRDEPLLAIDRAFIGLSLAVVALTLVGSASGWLPLKYNPFADLPWPEFSPVGAAIAVSCTWPALRLTLLPAERLPRAEDIALSPRTARS